MEVRVVLLLCMLSLCAGCFPSHISSVGQYGDGVSRQPAKGSHGQAVVTRSMPFTFDEVMDASEAALFRKGFPIEEKDRRKGFLSSSVRKGAWPQIFEGNFVGTIAIYVKQTSPRPATEVTVVVDRYVPVFGSVHENSAANILLGDIQKVLATYR